MIITTFENNISYNQAELFVLLAKFLNLRSIYNDIIKGGFNI